jgi:hypothetical protein
MQPGCKERAKQIMLINPDPGDKGELFQAIIRIFKKSTRHKLNTAKIKGCIIYLS